MRGKQDKTYYNIHNSGPIAPSIASDTCPLYILQSLCDKIMKKLYYAFILSFYILANIIKLIVTFQNLLCYI